MGAQVKLNRREFLKLSCGLPFLDLASFAQITATRQQAARKWSFAKKRGGNGLAFPVYFVKERLRHDERTHRLLLPLEVRNG